MNRLDSRRVHDLEARLQRAERINRQLAAMVGVTVDELEAAQSPGVRHGMPATAHEYAVFCRLHNPDGDE